jgi:hypothetical protein
MMKTGGYYLVRLVQMFSGNTGSTRRPFIKGRTRSLLTAGALILSAIVLVCSVALLISNKSPKRTPVPKEAGFVAELIKARGMVLVQNSGKSEWWEAKAGARLMEGDLIRTENSGEADIRYKNGNTISIFEKTVFTVRSRGDNRMEISMAPGGSRTAPVLVAEESSAAGARKDGSKPFIKLKKIVPYGRSLELIGQIEPGDRLVINDEMVEVTGDGSFKHFTNPFPGSDNLAQLNMKVTDLAGRSWYWTATFDFGPHDGEE